MKRTVFLDIAPCSPLKVNLCVRKRGRFPAQCTLFLLFAYISKTDPFQGHHKLLFLSPIGSLGGCMRAQRFHSVSRWANGNWGPLFHFPPASSITQNFLPADYSACHLISHWYLAWLIQPWRWRQCVPPKHRLTFNVLHSAVSQKVFLFKFSDARCAPVWCELRNSDITWSKQWHVEFYTVVGFQC
jgi:hypothetical protein